MTIHVRTKRTTYCPNKYKTGNVWTGMQNNEKGHYDLGCGHVSSGQFVYEYACLCLSGTNIE